MSRLRPRDHRCPLESEASSYKSTSAKPSSAQRSRTDDFHLSYPSRGPRVRCNAAQRAPNTLRTASQAFAHQERVSPHRLKAAPHARHAASAPRNRATNSVVRAPRNSQPPRPRPRRARGARLDAARRGRRGRRARRRAATAARRDDRGRPRPGSWRVPGSGPAATPPHPQHILARRKVAERTHAAATRRPTTSPCLNS